MDIRCCKDRMGFEPVKECLRKRKLVRLQRGKHPVEVAELFEQ